MHRIKMSEAKTSSWVALQNPAFSKLWFATVTSGICVSAHDTAATWMMNSTSHSTLLLSLMSTAATLPFFLFILPAGALADITDHKKMLSAAYIWLAVCAGGLAILGATSWNSDILTDPNMAPWRAEALKRGYASCMALPLMSQGEAFGALALYAEESDALTSRALKRPATAR
jgi:MFS family permease